MCNLGLCELALVAPECDVDDPRGRLLATQGEEILEQARIVDDLGEAVANCGLVAATSARGGGLYRRQNAGTPRELLPLLVKAMADRPCALVFGPEDHGLTNDEVTRCHYLIHIPTEAAHPALNLAQAVAICLYELRLAWRERLPPSPTTEPPAAFADQERMFTKLRHALEDIHFLYGEKADALMHALRHLIGRAQPTAMELDIFYGLARQLRWVHGQMAGGNK
jgi:tRNA/rRNA methyltransferase